MHQETLVATEYFDLEHTGELNEAEIASRFDAMVDDIDLAIPVEVERELEVRAARKSPDPCDSVTDEWLED